MKYICPVCGYDALGRLPHGGVPDPSYEICPSCGFEFGITDDDEGITYEQWRNEWIANGMVWWSQSRKPSPNWDPKKQLRNVRVYV